MICALDEKITPYGDSAPIIAAPFSPHKRGYAIIRGLFGIWLVFRCCGAEGIQFKTLFIDAKDGWVG